LELILAIKFSNDICMGFQLNTAKGTNKMEFSDYVDTFFNSKFRDRFYSPAKIHWGIGISNDLAELISQKKVTFFVDRNLRNNDIVQTLLKSCHSSFHFFEICAPPSPEEIARITGSIDDLSEFIVAIGGGSTIDTAKCCIASKYFGDFHSLNLFGKKPTVLEGRAKPFFIALPSTAGTGAETSRYYVTYRRSDTQKVHGKSWFLVADMVFLDPLVAGSASNKLVVESAFDAFIHLCESFFCMEEENWFNNVLCINCLTKIREGIDDVFSIKKRDTGLLSLLCAASFAGVAISNVRTGHIHEMAGAFLEQTGLSHPQSLVVFWKEAFKNLDESKNGHTKINHIKQAFGFRTLEDLTDYWEALFTKHGVFKEIKLRLSALDKQDITQIQTKVVNKTMGDLVWINKECPTTLDEHVLNKIFTKSIENIYAGDI
jgi:alcohol dehydrogenase class IV